MRNFREYDIWKSGIQITRDVYKITEKFPASEKFGLISQIQRAAVSIPSNIAEGSARRTEKDFAQFLRIAMGSSFELETQLIVAQELDWIEEKELNDFVERLHLLQKQINHLIGLLK